MAMQRRKCTTERRWLGVNVQRLGWLARTIGVAVVLSCAAALAAEAGSVTLAWDRNPESNISGYVLYYGNAPGEYTGSVAVGNVTEYVFTEPVNGRSYFFAVQAVNFAGAGGGLSTEVNSANFRLADVLFDNGADGLWALTAGGIYQQLSPQNAKTMTTGDLDGNNVNEIIVDFGPALGIWIRWNGTTWASLHGQTTSGMITADLDGNGMDELIVNFPGQGVWVLWNGDTFQQMHNVNPARMAAGRIEGGGASLILDFTGSGIWVRRNTGAWFLLHPFNSTAMAVGDFDGDGHDDIAVAFGNAGVWIFKNGSSWMFAAPQQPSTLAAGNVDGGRADILLASFTPGGIWALRNTTTWALLHDRPAEEFVFADIDGDGHDEIVIDFGTGIGSWSWNIYSGWKLATAASPESLAGRATH
jgi:Fibronectin type III domain/FG-GAP repeat